MPQGHENVTNGMQAEKRCPPLNTSKGRTVTYKRHTDRQRRPGGAEKRTHPEWAAATDEMLAYKGGVRLARVSFKTTHWRCCKGGNDLSEKLGGEIWNVLLLLRQMLPCEQLFRVCLPGFFCCFQVGRWGQGIRREPLEAFQYY